MKSKTVAKAGPGTAEAASSSTTAASSEANMGTVAASPEAMPGRWQVGSAGRAIDRGAGRAAEPERAAGRCSEAFPRQARRTAKSSHRTRRDRLRPPFGPALPPPLPAHRSPAYGEHHRQAGLDPRRRVARRSDSGAVFSAAKFGLNRTGLISRLTCCDPRCTVAPCVEAGNFLPTRQDVSRGVGRRR
jgi:hypothetical protein